MITCVISSCVSTFPFIFSGAPSRGLASKSIDPNIPKQVAQHKDSYRLIPIYFFIYFHMYFPLIVNIVIVVAILTIVNML